MTRPVTRIDCGSRDWPVALVLVLPSVEDPGGSPGRVGMVPVVVLAPLDVVVDVVWLKAGTSRIAAAAKAIPRARD